MALDDYITNRLMPHDTRLGWEHVQNVLGGLDAADEYLDSAYAQDLATAAGCDVSELHAYAAEIRNLRRKIAAIKNAAERWIADTFPLHSASYALVWQGNDNDGNPQWRAVELQKYSDRIEAADPREAVTPRKPLIGDWFGSI